MRAQCPKPHTIWHVLLGWIGGRLLNLSAEVKLDAILEALELANDSISSYLDVEAGEVHSIRDEEFDLAGNLETAIGDFPAWQRPQE